MFALDRNLFKVGRRVSVSRCRCGGLVTWGLYIIESSFINTASITTTLLSRVLQAGETPERDQAVRTSRGSLLLLTLTCLLSFSVQLSKPKVRGATSSLRDSGNRLPCSPRRLGPHPPSPNQIWTGPPLRCPQVPGRLCWPHQVSPAVSGLVPVGVELKTLSFCLQVRTQRPNHLRYCLYLDRH